jgi:hypothetical protein
MRQRLAGMSPHLGVKKDGTSYARGAPLFLNFLMEGYEKFR